MSVLPTSASQFICQNLTSQWDGIKRWGLWEVIRIRWCHKRKALRNGVSALIRVKRELASYLLCALWGYKEAICSPDDAHQNQGMLAPRSWTSAFQNCKKYISVVYKPPSLWYFIIAAWTKTVSNKYRGGTIKKI